jgi:hypothetical protein
MPKITDLIIGICFLISGVVMLWQLPRYQRRVEAGEIRRDSSRPSLKTLRRAAVAFVVVGILFIVGWSFDLF